MSEVTIVIPVYNEGENIAIALERIAEEVKCDCIINIVYDSDEDTTVPVVNREKDRYKSKINLIKNAYGKGVLNAIKTGLETAKSEFVIVTMADLSDPPSVINDMLKTAIEQNSDIVCGSRYMKGGKQIGGPLVKGLMSRLAGVSLHYLAKVPTFDSTNSFKLYRKSFLDKMTVESTGGFELGLELVAKAHVGGYKISEVPTSWVDRVEGESNFKLLNWLPSYLKWYFYAFKKDIFQENELSDKKKRNISLSILSLIALINFVFIYLGTVNVPYQDEWELVKHLDKFDFSWLFAFHNEHRIVFTKIATFVLAKLDGWNFFTAVSLSYSLFLIEIGLLYSVLKKFVPKFSILPLFFIPLFSTVNYENFVIWFQSQFHFMIIFGCISVIYGFLKEDNFINKLIFYLVVGCSIFSMNLVFSAGIMFVYLLKELYYLKIKGAGLKNVLNFLLSAVVFILMISLFMQGFVKPSGHPNLVFPWNPYFWIFASNLFSNFVLGRTYPIFLEIILTSIILVSMLVFFLKKENFEDKNAQAVFALFMASCFSIVSITMGRAGFGLFTTSRHAEVVIILIPIIASVLYCIKSKYGKNFLFIYFLLLLIGFINSFYFFDYTKGILHYKKSNGLVCVENVYKYNKDASCPYVYWNDKIYDKVIYAKKINLSFTREFKKD